MNKTFTELEANMIPVKFRRQKTTVGGLFFTGEHHGVYPVYLWPGTIEKVEGVEEVERFKGVTRFEQLKPIGSVIPNSGSYEQCFALVHFDFESTEECGDVLRFVHKNLKVWDKKGKDIVFKMLDFDAVEMEKLEERIAALDQQRKKIERREYFKRRMMDELIYGRVSFRNQMDEAVKTFLTEEQLNDNQYVEQVEDDIIDCYITYKTRPRDYFYFGFQNLNDEERDTYLTETLEDQTLMEITGFEKYLDDLTDKYHFFERTKEFFHRKVILFDENTRKDEFVKECLAMRDVFVKPRTGSEGRGAFVETISDEDAALKLYEKLVAAKGMWLIEEKIRQSAVMARWNPTSVNTVRLSSFYNKNGHFVLGPIFRTGRLGSFVDNTSAGGIFALIYGATGEIVSKGYDINGNTYDRHPDSGLEFRGDKIPRWAELLTIAQKLHHLFPKHIFIAWDFALTDDGWDLVEGNWGRFRGAQIAGGNGLKHQFLEYMNGGSLDDSK